MEHRAALVLGAVLLTGCGHTLSQTVDASRKTLHGVAVAAEASAQTWAEQVDARIAYCARQRLPDQVARAQCMGVFGEGNAWEADFADLKAAYDTAAGALEGLAEAAARIEARTRGQEVSDR